MELAFWICAIWVVYAFVGYPLLSILLGRMLNRDIAKGNDYPSVTVVIAAFNEVDHIVDTVNFIRTLAQSQTASKNLQPKMVFLVDHNTKTLSLGYHRTARAFAKCVMTADQVPFDKKMTVKLRGLIHTDVKNFVPEFQRQKNIF